MLIWSLEKAVSWKHNRNFHVKYDHSICLYDTITLLIFAKWYTMGQGIELRVEIVFCIFNVLYIVCTQKYSSNKMCENTANNFFSALS